MNIEHLITACSHHKNARVLDPKITKDSLKGEELWYTLRIYNENYTFFANTGANTGSYCWEFVRDEDWAVTPVDESDKSLECIPLCNQWVGLQKTFLLDKSEPDIKTLLDKQIFELTLLMVFKSK